MTSLRENRSYKSRETVIEDIYRIQPWSYSRRYIELFRQSIDHFISQRWHTAFAGLAFLFR